MTEPPSWHDWDRWCDARIAAALAKHDRVQIEATGQALGKIRKQLRDEFAEQIAQLRAELQVEKADVIALPALPLRRRSSDAA